VQLFAELERLLREAGVVIQPESDDDGEGEEIT
jgi:hypothetical protein